MESCPASIAQERLWKLQHALADLPFFNVLYALRLTSPCDAAVLERSINEIVCRHEILRTTFAVIDGRYVQVIAPQLIVPLAFDDLRASSASARRLQTSTHPGRNASFVRSRTGSAHSGSPVALWPSRNTSLLISMHQVICDGWSLGVFVEELVTLYDALSAEGETSLAPLSYQYADFAHWQRHWQSHPEIASQLAYWREQLRGPLPAIQLAKSAGGSTIDDLQTARQ